MRLRRTGNHDDDPRMDRYEETRAWSSIPCHCGARYRVEPWGEAPRRQCEACEEADAREDRHRGPIMDAICSAKSNEDAAALGALYVKLPRARATTPPNTAEAIDAERAAAIRRSDYYDGDAIAWLRDVDEPDDLTTLFCDPLHALEHTCSCGAPKAVDRTLCDSCNETEQEVEP